MSISKPLVTIVMATYNPPVRWFEKQLISLNEQDYENIELIILDDCSPKISIDELNKVISEHITNFPFKLYRNEKNLGSTKTFEKLTEMAGGKYISYCDQDDIWESYKVSKSVEIIERSGALLVYGDVKVIDGDDNITAASITELRKRQISYSGTGLAKILLFKNFVTGCTVLMNRKTAQDSCPFLDNMIHDQWLALYASIRGRIEICDGTIMKYRIHGSNQTGVLSGVRTKNDYYNKRIRPFHQQMKDIANREQIDDLLPKSLKWAKAREDYYNGKLSAIWTILKYRKFNKSTAFFEISLKFMPNFIFNRVLKKLQNAPV